MIEGMESDERIGRLLDELTTYGVIGSTSEPEPEPEPERESTTDVENGGPVASRTAANVEGVFADVPPEDFRFDEGIVKENLEVVLLVLIAARDGAHGKRLMGDLSDFFDVQLSPGTVYPRLHDLEAAGVLQVHELVRTKEYTIADEAGVRDRIERAMYQHLALGAVFRRSLGHVERPRSKRD